ncbi:MAG TPA: helix-turn-helix transcriptional regulator [Solirubrobacterales bacterium]|nr:helix-turn-helix transcriptional regulator [Solirubrobacterales bacterium]
MATKTKTPKLPANLPAALDSAGLSQWDLAQKTGIHPSEVQRIVGRGMRPTDAQAAKIAKALR